MYKFEGAANTPSLSLKLPYFVHLHSTGSLKQTWMETLSVFFHLHSERLTLACLVSNFPKSETLVRHPPIWWMVWVFIKHTCCMWKKQIVFYIQALLWRSLLTAFRCYANFLPPPSPVSLEVQLVNNKLGDVFLHVTQLDSYIASIQRGKCNALDCIEKWPILCSSSIFQGLFLLLSWTHMHIQYIQYE